MPSSYSQNGVELMAAGEDVNTWGDPKLNNALKRLNYLGAGYQAIAITGDYALTSSITSTVQSDFQTWNALIKFTGALSVNATITVPSIPMRWAMWNATNKVLTITAGAGTTLSIDPGDRTIVDCDGMAIQTINFGGLDLKPFIAASALAATGTLPGLAGNAGKYLFTDGTNALWRQPSTTDLSDYQAKVLGVQVALAVAL